VQSIYERILNSVNNLFRLVMELNTNVYGLVDDNDMILYFHQCSLESKILTIVKKRKEKNEIKLSRCTYFHQESEYCKPIFFGRCLFKTAILRAVPVNKM